MVSERKNKEMAALFGPTFLGDFLGHIIRYEFAAAQAVVITESKRRRSRTQPSKTLEKDVEQLLRALADFAIFMGERHVQTRTAGTAQPRAVNPRKWPFGSSSLVALKEAPEARRAEVEQDEKLRDVFPSLPLTPEEQAASNGGGACGGAAAGSTAESAVARLLHPKEAQHVSLCLVAEVLAAEFRSLAAAFTRHGNELGAQINSLPDSLCADFSTATARAYFFHQQHVFTSLPFFGPRRASSPQEQPAPSTIAAAAAVAVSVGQEAQEQQQHTLPALLEDMALILGAQAQAVRVYDWLAAGGTAITALKSAGDVAGRLAAFVGSVLSALDAALQSGVVDWLVQHGRFELGVLNHLLCATASLLQWNSVPTLLSLYTARQLLNDWRRFHNGLLGERQGTAPWLDNAVFCFLWAWAQHLAVKTAFVFHSASHQAQQTPAAVPFIYPQAYAPSRPASHTTMAKSWHELLQGGSSASTATASTSAASGVTAAAMPAISASEGVSAGPTAAAAASGSGTSSGVVFDLVAEMDRLVSTTERVVSVAVLLNSTKEVPYNAAGYTCWADEEARQSQQPTGLDAWCALLDAPRGSFDRKFTIDLSMLYYQAQADLALCRPCTAQVSSVKDLVLDVVIQKVSPAEELFVVVLVNPRVPVPHHVRAKNADAYHKTVLASVQQFTDKVASVLSLKHTFAMLRAAPAK